MTHIVQLVILTSFILFLCGLFIVWFFLYHGKRMAEHKMKINQLQLEKSEQYLRDAVQIQEEERSRIGADIHDDIGPVLSALKLRIHRLSDTYQFTEDDNVNTTEMISESIKSIRKIAHNLYPSSLEEHGLVATLDNSVQRMVQSTNIEYDCEITEDFDVLDDDEKLGIYRITMEFVNNAIKYSGCKKILISGQKSGNVITYEIREDGCGYNVDNTSGNGMGLKNMEMRSKVINFDFSLSSRPNEGSKLTMFKKF